MTMFFAQRVILGKTGFAEVPPTLKAGVKKFLLDHGLEFLIEEE